MFFRIMVTFPDGRVQDNIVCEQPTAKEALKYARARFDAITEAPKSIDVLRITRDAAAEIADGGGIDWRQ